MTTETYTISGTKATILKDPDAVLDYTFDWSEWLGLVQDTITAVVFTIDNGAEVTQQTNSANTATAYVAGGDVDKTATLTCHITTAAGREDDRSIFLKIRQR